MLNSSISSIVRLQEEQRLKETVTFLIHCYLSVIWNKIFSKIFTKIYISIYAKQMGFILFEEVCFFFNSELHITPCLLVDLNLRNVVTSRCIL